MAVPKKKTSKSRKGMRRSHHAIQPATLIRCSRCGAVQERHRICSGCGYYRGKPVLVVDEGF